MFTRYKIFTYALFLAMGGTFFASAGMAQSAPTTETPGPARSPGYEQHDGFFLRANLGFGGVSVSNAQPSDYTDRYGSIQFEVDAALGAAVTENLILHATLLTSFAPSGKVYDGTQEYRQSLNLYSLGAGITYYFMPINLYLSGSVVGSLLAITEEAVGNSIFSDTDTRTAAGAGGFGGQVMIGKEWWIMPQFGVGIALSGYLGHLVDFQSNRSGNWTYGSGSLLFTGTYN